MVFAGAVAPGRLQYKWALIELERRGREAEKSAKSKVIRFKVPSKIMKRADVYNPSAPLRGVIAGRVEKRNSEYSKSVFFAYDKDLVKNGSLLEVDGKAPVFDNLQDPFLSQYKQDVIFGGVRLISQQKDNSTFRTVIFRAKDIYSLDPNAIFAAGPIGEKDIRVLELDDGAVLVARRPQGGDYGNGRIYYQLIDGIELLPGVLGAFDGAKYLSTPLLEEHYATGGWAGINQMLRLEDGTVGIVGHLGRFDQSGNRDYKAFALRLDPRSGTATEMKIIADIGNVQKRDPKRQDLLDVVFPGGIERHGDGTASLFLGVRDSYTVELSIPDPFI